MDKRKPDSLQNCLKIFRSSWTDFDNLTFILDNWQTFVGKDLSKECKPLKMEIDVLTICVNEPQWRQALIYSKHKLKENINKAGLKLKNIRIIQNYSDEISINNYSDTKKVWENHPSRIKDNQIITCKFCNRPTPKGEIKRWGKCTFCWRKNN